MFFSNFHIYITSDFFFFFIYTLNIFTHTHTHTHTHTYIYIYIYIFINFAILKKSGVPHFGGRACIFWDRVDYQQWVSDDWCLLVSCLCDHLNKSFPTGSLSLYILFCGGWWEELSNLWGILGSARMVKSTWWIKYIVCITKSQRILCILFSRTDSGLCIYHLVVFRFQTLALFPLGYLSYPVLPSLVLILY